GKPNLPELTVLVGVFFEQHDRHDLAVMLTAVDPVTYQINHYDDGFDAAVGRRLEDHLNAGVSAAEALHVDAPLFLPLEPCVGQLRDHRLRLTDRNKALVNHFVGVVEADEAVLERQRIDGPSAACLGDGALLPKSPGAAAFALKQHHRPTGAADDGCRIDVGERCLERRQGGERTSCRRGGNLLASEPFVIAIVVGVIAVAVMIAGVVHACLPPWKASSASENARAISTRPGIGACAFSTRTSETPERVETINSCGTFKPRAFATMAIAWSRIFRSAALSPIALVLLARGVSSRPEYPHAHTSSISAGVACLMARPPFFLRRSWQPLQQLAPNSTLASKHATECAAINARLDGVAAIVQRSFV